MIYIIRVQYGLFHAPLLLLSNKALRTDNPFRRAARNLAGTLLSCPVLSAERWARVSWKSGPYQLPWPVTLLGPRTVH